jgi:hypothetical protein
MSHGVLLPVSAMHEEMDEGTQEKNQIGQCAQYVSSMLGPEKKRNDKHESRKSAPIPRGAGRMVVRSIRVHLVAPAG